MEQVCERHYFRGHIRTVYQISGLKNHKKIIVIVNCRTGYKFEYYQKNPQDFKISSLKPEISPEIPFSNNFIIHKPVV